MLLYVYHRYASHPIKRGKATPVWHRLLIRLLNESANYFPAIESDTVRRARPLARRRASTLRPSGVDILSRKPCLLTLFLFDGWNVLFIAYRYFLLLFSHFFGLQRYKLFSNYANLLPFFLIYFSLLASKYIAKLPYFPKNYALNFLIFPKIMP